MRLSHSDRETSIDVFRKRQFQKRQFRKRQVGASAEISALSRLDGNATFPDGDFDASRLLPLLVKLIGEDRDAHRERADDEVESIAIHGLKALQSISIPVPDPVRHCQQRVRRI